MTRTPKTDTPTEAPKQETPAERAATFDLNDPVLQGIIASAVQAALSQQKAEAVKVMNAMGSNGRSERSLKNEIAVVRAFRKAGFGDVKPHEDVRTFNRWVAAGFRPVEGSKSLRIANLRLFHRSQCRPITAEEKASTQEQQQAAIKHHEGGKVVPIGTSPQ